jgi:hypothetical protein
LTPAEKELLRQWIAQGGTYQKHWAFEVPSSRPLPIVKQSALVRNPIDTFVLSKLESKALQPQAEADRAAWRACTPEERLDAVEALRLQAGKFLYEYPVRLRRLLAITRVQSR